MERIAGKNGFGSEHAGAGAFSFPRSFGLDGFDHLHVPGPIDFRRQMGPARYGRKSYRLDRGIANRSDIFTAKAGGKLQVVGCAEIGARVLLEDWRGRPL